MGTLERLVVLLVAVGLSLPSGCGGQVVSAGGVSVLTSQRSGSGMDALGGGRLEVIGGCLGASGVVIVWPHGTKVVDDEPLTIDIPDNGTFAIGDEVKLGGGFVVEHSSDDITPGPHQVGGVTVPASCAEHDILLAH